MRKKKRSNMQVSGISVEIVDAVAGEPRPPRREPRGKTMERLWTGVGQEWGGGGAQPSPSPSSPLKAGVRVTALPRETCLQLYALQRSRTSGWLLLKNKSCSFSGQNPKLKIWSVA